MFDDRAADREHCHAMKRLTRTLGGIAASILLAAGLHAAAGKLDPITQDAGLNKPEDSTTDQGKVANLPCMPCENEN